MICCDLINVKINDINYHNIITSPSSIMKLNINVFAIPSLIVHR